MFERVKNKYPQRVIFPKGAQRKFIFFVQKRLERHDLSSLAHIVGVHPRTLTDWKRGKFLIALPALQKMCAAARIPFPSHATIKDAFWHSSRAGIAGGIAMYKKYGRIGGDPEYRKKKWYAWWRKEGRFKDHPILYAPLPIKKPRPSVHLAEFVGILLGDGGITKNQIIITLHNEEKEYRRFVMELFRKLFGVQPSCSERSSDSTYRIVVSRTALVRFCTKKLGLKIGNKVKQQVDIPSWIKKNERFQIGCLRGLMDTDGCVFTHHYKVNNKVYVYKKLAFSNGSRPLLSSVYDILKKNGFHPRYAQGKDVRLDSKEDVKRFFHIIGTHNPKYLKRYKT